MSKLVLIHDSVKDKDDIINSLSYRVNYIILSSAENIDDFDSKIAPYLDSEYVGVIFDNTGKRAPFFEFTMEELSSIDIEKELYPVPSFPTSGKFFSDLFIEELSKFKNVSFIDLITCNVVPDDTFMSNMRYSTNITGINGDWILESHNIDVSTLYFEEEIKLYSHILGVKADPPFNISTPEELLDLMTSTNITVMGGSYTLLNDINMSGYLSQSIGKNGTPFTGSFNGQGYTISIGESISSGFGGLFGHKILTTSSISNINLIYLKNPDNYNIQATLTGIDIVGLYTGGMIARNEGGVVNNCKVVYMGNPQMSGLRNGGFCNNNGGIVSNCTAIFESDVNMSGDRCGGFASNNFNTGPDTCNMNDCSALFKKNLIIAGNEAVGIAAGVGGFCGTNSNAQINNCSLTIIGNATFTGYSIGGFLNQGQLVSQINNCSINVLTNATFISQDVTGNLISQLNTSSVNNLTGFFMSNVISRGTELNGSIGLLENRSTVTNCNVSYIGDVEMTANTVGGLVGFNQLSSTVRGFNMICRRSVKLTGTTGSAGICGSNVISTFENCSVLYGSSTTFDGPNMAGICVENTGTFTDCVAVYNRYIFINNFGNISATFITGSGTNCYSTTYIDNTVTIPNDNHQDVIDTLNSNTTYTNWVSNLLAIQQQIEPINNSGNLASIFSNSSDVSKQAKNNAILNAMDFAGIESITTTSDVIEPLLVKYVSPLPASINYLGFNKQGSSMPPILSKVFSLEAGVNYIGQNIANITLFNTIITSSVVGNGSVIFDTEEVPVGSSINIGSAKIAVKGVGSSLLELSDVEPEVSSKNDTAVILMIFGLILLGLAFIVYYIYEHLGLSLLSLLVSITLIIISIVLFL